MSEAKEVQKRKHVYRAGLLVHSAKACEDIKTENRLVGHVHTFQYFDGVTRLLIFGRSAIGKKCGHDAEKVMIFVVLSLDSQGHPRYLKMQVTPNIKQASVKKLRSLPLQKTVPHLSDAGT